MISLNVYSFSYVFHLFYFHVSISRDFRLGNFRWLHVYKFLKTRVSVLINIWNLFTSCMEIVYLDLAFSLSLLLICQILHVVQVLRLAKADDKKMLSFCFKIYFLLKYITPSQSFYSNQGIKPGINWEYEKNIINERKQ